jgi:antiviral helicase SLH1
MTTDAPLQGKTDVAMLTVLRVLDQHRDQTQAVDLPNSIKRDDFKIIYVCVLELPTR